MLHVILILNSLQIINPFFFKIIYQSLLMNPVC